MTHFLAKYIVVANTSTGNCVHHWTNVTKHFFLLAEVNKLMTTKGSSHHLQSYSDAQLLCVTQIL